MLMSPLMNKRNYLFKNIFYPKRGPQAKGVRLIYRFRQRTFTNILTTLPLSLLPPYFRMPGRGISHSLGKSERRCAPSTVNEIVPCRTNGPEERIVSCNRIVTFQSRSHLLSVIDFMLNTPGFAPTHRSGSSPRRVWAENTSCHPRIGCPAHSIVLHSYNSNCAIHPTIQ